MRRAQGFTVIELLIVIVFFAFASLLFFVQRNNLEVASRDTQRKTAINAMYYDLENVFYVKNQYYPESLSKDTLTAIDPALLTDPNGHTVGTSASNYRYLPTNCMADKCQSYTLRSSLENEADFVKTSRHS